MEHIVTNDEENLRADKLVRDICKDIGYTFLQKLFRLGKIKVNGRKISASNRVHSGDFVEIFANLQKLPRMESNSQGKMFDQLKSMIIFENEDFFAINKPTGLAAQLGTKVSLCVETFIKSYPGCTCHLVHRLDKYTSGVLLVAKNLKSARKLTKLFRENGIKKTYLAIVDGKILQSGIMKSYLQKSFVGNEEKMTVSCSGKMAITFYNPLQLFGDFTLLELSPSTGRKHQLRVQCAELLNAPIIGDRKYNRRRQHRNFFLHAHKIFLKDLGIEITAEIPKYFYKMISSSNIC
ncbi:MAG: RluA family pseudouridine synthase [Holosporaceae bacterium]|jgi:23S rRNA pseudouridine955/2504/2580 synthase|nr:RluA family pseudouridine synthase [Holosporaceae bacterium]